MEHKHIYDKNGKRICCNQEERIYHKADATDILEIEHAKNDVHQHDEHEANDHDEQEDENHDHSGGENQSTFQQFLPAIISFSLLMLGIALDYYFKPEWFTGWVRIALYAFAYFPVGFPVMKEAVESIGKGEIFSEFLLMSLPPSERVPLVNIPKAWQ